MVPRLVGGVPSGMSPPVEAIVESVGGSVLDVA